MKIVINGKAFVKKYKTGVQRYCIEILKALDNQISNENIELVVPKYCNIEEKQYSNIKIIKYGKMNINLWEQIELPIYANKQNALIVNLCNTSPLINPGIVCIHDINCIKNKKYYPLIFRNWYKIMMNNSIKKAKRIITVSNFSKNEIEEWYKIKNVEVVYNSYEHILRINADENVFDRIKTIKKGKYFFTLGTVQKNKNIDWILNVAKNNQDKTFVISGYMNQNGINLNLDNVIYTGYLTDEEIKALMKYCIAYIMPSFYEGFGLPPLEAFSLGKNIIASDIPIMHEIFEDEIMYIDPYNYNVKLNELKEAENRDKILKKYSWEKSANQLLQIIKAFIKI